MTLRLGVIGSSPGNGHPYSWSAICNGYNPEVMLGCDFPAIPEYLALESWPDVKLPGVAVTHVWTQDIELSRHIAKAALIEHVVESREEMIGEIDALLLARDDARSHRALAEPFLRAGLPVYIDKPVALSLEDFFDLHDLQSWEGQIFSCSALRYAQELQLTKADRETLGPIRMISATTPKYWDTYAVHLIDPLLAHFLTPCETPPRQLSLVETSDKGRKLMLSWGEENVVVSLTALGGRAHGPIDFRLHGERAWTVKQFVNTFSAFRSALQDFISRIGGPPDTKVSEFNRKVVEMVQMGRPENSS